MKLVRLIHIGSCEHKFSFYWAQYLGIGLLDSMVRIFFLPFLPF
jgi:hypothetical protein